MLAPYRTTGSLLPAFAPARLVGLAVKHAFAIALYGRCPTALSVPSYSSVTFWEETAPVKLPTMHGPRPGFTGQGENLKQIRVVFQGWLHRNWRPGFTASHLSYTNRVKVQCKATVKVHGVFPSCRGAIASSQTFQLL